MMYLSRLLFVVVALLMVACKDSRVEESGVALPSKQEPTLAALPLIVPEPVSNTTTPQKAALGKLLFYDPILSGSKDVACATCHHPQFAYAESIELSIGAGGKGLGSKRKRDMTEGIPLVKRNAQSIVNTAYNGMLFNHEIVADKAPMFWDLRVKGLEEQALEPIKAFEEMRGTLYSEHEIVSEVLERLNKNEEYRALFVDAFPYEEGGITEPLLSRAIAAFERSLVANNSRFDQYMRGDTEALSSNEIEGMRRFEKAGCISCHNGPMFSDYKVHAIGVIDHEALGFIDKGKDSLFAFRTPTLRNLRFTFPYMHNGKLRSIRRVLEFYEDLSGGKLKNKNMDESMLDPLVKDLNVDFKDISLIEEFINSLNDENYDKTIPETVPSGLAVGGDI